LIAVSNSRLSTTSGFPQLPALHSNSSQRLNTNEREKERERERERERGNVQLVKVKREGQENISSILKVPRQCPFIFLVELMHIIGINFYDVSKAPL
jgi:hypothetical protein